MDAILNAVSADVLADINHALSLFIPWFVVIYYGAIIVSLRCHERGLRIPAIVTFFAGSLCCGMMSLSSACAVVNAGFDFLQLVYMLIFGKMCIDSFGLFKDVYNGKYSGAQ